MKKLVLILILALSLNSFAEDKKMSEQILGRWAFDVPAALVEMEKNLGGPVPADIKDQLVRELQGSFVLIQKSKIVILYLAEERTLEYKVVSERAQDVTAEFKAEQGQMVTKTLAMKGDLLYVSEGSKVMMILKRVKKNQN